MAVNINDRTPGNSVLALIDHQPFVALPIESHEDAKQRMIAAGATPTTWMALVSEWAPDSTAPEFAALYPVLAEHGGALALNAQYVLAQLQAGIVATPAVAGPPAPRLAGA